MSKSSPDKHRSGSQARGVPDDFVLETPWESTTKILGVGLDALASLRLTVALMAMAVFIVMAGTLGQVHRDIWDVINDYFRMNFSDESTFWASISMFGRELILPTPLTWIDLSIFFPPSFWEASSPPDLSVWHAPARLLTSLVMGIGWAALVWLIPMRDKKFQLGLFAAIGLTFSLLSIHKSGFWFPKGWTIGLVMAANLLSAHLVRFKIQADGARLWSGVGVIALGILATFGVIKSGSNKDGVLEENRFFGGLTLDWGTVWILFECTLAVVLVLGMWGYISLWRRTLQNPNLSASERSATVIMRRIAGLCNLGMAGLLVYLVLGGSETQLDDSGMRILWQLLKATLAGLILLAGCVLVFRKRAGVVVLHAGVALMMLSELLVGVAAVESQMRIIEGESSNYVQDVREVEIAVIDPSDPEVNQVIAIPKRFIKEGNLIQDEKLPVNIEIEDYYRNSELVPVGPIQENQATHGFGKSIRDVTIPIDNYYRGKARKEDIGVAAREIQGSTGTDNASSVDQASAYVSLYSKKENGENDVKLGTWLLSQNFFDATGDFEDLPQTFEVDGKTYTITLRFKRTYKPYTITLKEASQTNYVGTATPRDYRSIVDLHDPSRNEDRKDIHIWMNNPLRFAGETFYQSGLSRIRSGVDMTTLSVVTNDGWMIPYVACMIVAVGMLAHFMITLLRFLNRDSRIAPTRSGSTLDDAQKPMGAADVDPLHRPPAKPWITPLLAVGLVLVFGGYLAKKWTPPEPGKDGFDYYRAGQIPVAYEGRVKPLDTLARNALRMMSNRQEFVDESGEKQPALKWLLDLMTDVEASNKHPVFRVDYPPLLNTLGLEKRKSHLYSYDEIMKKRNEFRRQLQQAIESKGQDVYQRRVMELERRIRVREHMALALNAAPIGGYDALTDLIGAWGRDQELVKLFGEERATFPLFASQSTGDWERFALLNYRHELLSIAEKHDANSAEALAVDLVQDFRISLAARKIARLRESLQDQARNKHQTFAETALQNAENAQSETLKEVYTRLSEIKPSDTDLKVVFMLSDGAVETISFEEAEAFLSEGGLSGNAALGQLAFASVRNIRAILDEKPLSEFEQEAPYADILAAYKANDPEAFNAAVDAWFVGFADHPPEDHEKPISWDRLEFESYFNHAAPFWYLAVIYLIAGLLAAISWLACYQPLNRATFWLLAFALVVHTAALIGRIYISGRPPVTNLYSSAVFIGWGCVLIGLLFEWFYDIGIGNVVAAVAGFLTLGVAHLLTTEVATSRGDTFTVLQAVLDTQFWLATHVVCISMGYAATYMAGLFGVLYILGGAFTPLLTSKRRKDLLRMMYGTLCFAIFFSFVGTVLGGLWADDSWGRFWGWDTKENGALIIVLWNALVLHARWGGIVKDKGLACLTVAGNIAVSWSWFGVNELGIGLHAYGQTEGVVRALAIVCVSQLVLIAIGCLPKQYWWSHIAEENEGRA